MKPGRELDALIAEKVMGIEPWPGRPGGFKAKFVPHGVESKPCLPPEYSTDIAAAWQVMVKFKHLHPFINYDDTCCQWTAGFHNTDNEICVFSDIDGDSSAPHAICLAALKAIGHKMDDSK